MLPFTILLTLVIIWCLLSLEGIKRGLRGEIVIYRSWGDFALTVALVIPVLSLIIVLPWLWTTTGAHQSKRDLWVVIPAKISLTILFAVCSVIAAFSAVSALSPKTEMKRRLANGAIA